MTELNTIVAKNLRSLRESLGFTQSEMAERIGIAMRSYQKYESGDRFPKASVIDSICKEFSISKAELLTDEHLEDQHVLSAFDASIIIQKVSLLSPKNRDILLKSLDLMLKGQESVPQKKKASY